MMHQPFSRGRSAAADTASPLVCSIPGNVDPDAADDSAHNARPEPVEGRAPGSWFDKLTTSGRVTGFHTRHTDRMTLHRATLCLLLSLTLVGYAQERPPRGNDQRPETTMWYRHPAENWNEALPIGNGRLGAMVFGGVGEERLQLNEDTVWAGEKRDRLNPAGPAAVAEVRRLLFAGKAVEAEALADKAI